MNNILWRTYQLLTVEIDFNAKSIYIGTVPLEVYFKIDNNCSVGSIAMTAVIRRP